MTIPEFYVGRASGSPKTHALGAQPYLYYYQADHFITPSQRGHVQGF
jgi:hypothetical protein